ncbi:putative ArsR family transcriptional regulator [Kribbella sp. VKM Ac-2527]|uniref:Putative ArsR family transcriptional regulator n=1 Tax=Kribbella caucasensis TaxID=2512215 RepID=A0A4R6KAQ0_9ACTN|nr:putative ArsR family transcriptional regulator [Kribbella sp. VKM Ac-2527]
MEVGFRVSAVDDTLVARILAVAALEEPTRRRLYDHVVRQAAPVTRDEAATAVGVPRATAAFHLDRLNDEGLLDVVYERRSGRSGPGAGRPSKLYRRSDRHVAVSLPEHRYDLAGRLLATAIEDAEATGESPRAALDRLARKLGNELGAAARDTTSGASRPDAVMGVLEQQGFEPRADANAIVLGNCPFHSLAQQHTDLVCEMNLCLLDGLLTGLDATQLQAHLKPEPGHCCVRLEPAPEPGS